MKRLVVFTAAIAAAIAVTQQLRHAADATSDPSRANSVTITGLLHQDAHTSLHESHRLNATKRNNYLTGTEHVNAHNIKEGNSSRYTTRKTIRDIRHPEKQKVGHRRPKVSRKGHQIYKRPMRGKTSLSWVTNSVALTNHSQLYPSSAEFLTSYQNNTYKFPPENYSITDSSIVQRAPKSSRDEAWFPWVQQSHGVKPISNDNLESQPPRRDEAKPSQKQETEAAVNDDVVTYKLPDSENIFEDRMSLDVRHQKSQIPVHEDDVRNQSQPDIVHLRKVLSELNENVVSSLATNDSHIDNISVEWGDDPTAVSLTNHRGTERNIHHGDIRKINVANETDYFYPPLKTRQPKSASYSTTGTHELHTGVGTNRKAKQLLSEPVVPNTVSRSSQQRQYTENYGMKDLNHLGEPVTPEGRPNPSKVIPFQKFTDQPLSIAQEIETKNQDEDYRNTTTHKLRHQRRRKVLGQHQANSPSRLNLTSELKNDSHSRNVSHPTYNVYNFYGPVIIADRALRPISAKDPSSQYRESGPLISGSYNHGNGSISAQALNVTETLNYSSQADDGMSMLFLPTRLIKRLLQQSYNHENDASGEQAERSRGTNINSDGTLYHGAFNESATSSEFNSPSLPMEGGPRLSPAWSEGTPQIPSAIDFGVKEYNTGTGAGSVGFSNMGSAMMGSVYPNNSTLHSGTSVPVFNYPEDQGSHISSPQSSGGQWSGFSGASTNQNGVDTYSTGNVDNNFAVTARNYDPPITGNDNSVINGNSNIGIGQSYDRGTVPSSGNFPPEGATIGTGVGVSDLGSMPNQGTHFGNVPDTSFTGPPTQQDRGWKIRGRIGFQWNPDHSGVTDSGMLAAPSANVWGNQWVDYRNLYGPPVGVPNYNWQGSPPTDWQGYNAPYPSTDNVYGGYSPTTHPNGNFMPPPYTEYGTSAARTGYMWFEGDIHRVPDYTTPQDLQPATYDAPGRPAGGGSSPRKLPTHSQASLVGGVPYGAARRTPSGRFPARRPTHSNQFYRPRPQGGTYNPKALHSLG